MGEHYLLTAYDFRCLQEASPPMKLNSLFGAILLMTLAAARLPAQKPMRDPLAEGFRHVPAAAQLRMYWRVFGPTWRPEEADEQFRLLKEAGVGGIMTYFTYPVVLDDPAKGLKTERFLSPEFLKTFGEMARLAKAHGLRFGFSGGTGWPYGGPTVSAEQSAQRIRRVALMPSADGKSYLLPPLQSDEQVVVVLFRNRDVTAQLKAGSLPADEPPSGETAAVPQAFIAGPTRMQVKRPSLGGEGLVLDHYSPEATERYLDATVAPLLDAAPGLVESIYCDSLEVYNANWTRDLPEEFRKRRGYKLPPLLPALFETNAYTPFVRFDFWRTLAELMEERFTQTTGDWARRRGVLFEMEAIGTPPNPLTAARYIDLPTGEQYEPEGFSFSRYASSGAHLAGRRIVGTEAWTWAGVPNRLADTLSDLKLLSDIHFLAGCNDLTGVDFPYSPRSAGSPGWLPYYGPAINQNHPQWPHFHALADYTGRCSWMLRQGKPIADVALYLPVEDSFVDGPTEQMPLNFLLRDHFATGEKTDEFGLQNAFRHHSDLIRNLLTHGFNFDGIDFFAMERLAQVRGGRLVCGDGDYRIVILPNLQRIHYEALKKIIRFCRAGGTVIATERLPVRDCGMRAASINKISLLMQRLFGVVPAMPGDKVVTHAFGSGHAIFLPDARESLVAALAQLRPDVSITPYQSHVGFVHRRVGKRDLYFLANFGDRSASFEATFRVGAGAAMFWNALDGAMTPLATKRTPEGDASISLELSARGSAFIVFDPVSSPAPGSLSASEPPIVLQSRPLPPLNWRVAFDGPNAPPPYETQQLVSWTQMPDAKYFSGRATYTTRFRYDDPLPRRCLLRLEQVRESAEIVVNGKAAGLLWTPPWEIDVTPFLKQGENTLSITVANLPINRFIGLPDEDLRPLRAVYGARFPAPEEKSLVKEPLPSGLIGGLVLRIAP